MMALGNVVCPHDELLLECSTWAKEAGFERPDAAKRLAATTRASRNPLAVRGESAKVIKKLSAEVAERVSPSFPGPLLLPKDELNWDPDCPPQSFRSWLTLATRNKLTPERRTLYIAAPPIVTPSVGFMHGWEQPTTTPINDELNRVKPPSADDSLKFVSAFYHDLPVNILPHQLRFVPWTGTSKRTRSRSSHACVGLASGNGCTRIRTRESPDKKFKRQLNLNDLLDAAIDMLPGDAHSIVLLMDLDMYEDDDDDFCCGRAYGGSRVCVVSSARYHPLLDADENINYDHMWPTSHCKKFVDELCAVEGLEPAKYIMSVHETRDSPLRRAVEASRKVPATSNMDSRSGLWFSRVARTLVHELGHCFGMGHCIYYACNMQGTSGMAEDVRQPPYLCPVCLEKIAYAIAFELERRSQEGKEAYIKERYQAIAEFCETWKQVGLFAGYGGWVQARLEHLSV